jgi:hypothetical protein
VLRLASGFRRDGLTGGHRADLSAKLREEFDQELTFFLGQDGESLGRGRVDNGKHLVDEVSPFVGDVDQDLPPVSRMGQAHGKAAAFECVEQRGHARGAHDQLFGDDMAGPRFAGPLDDSEGLECAGRQRRAWAIFKTYLAAAAQQAAEPIVTKYLDKLSGADVFTVDNAYTLFESLRIDAGTLGPFGIRP